MTGEKTDTVDLVGRHVLQGLQQITNLHGDGRQVNERRGFEANIDLDRLEEPFASAIIEAGSKIVRPSISHILTRSVYLGRAKVSNMRK